jgi:DNA-binding beta-propeller fold protein YncE
MSATQLYKSRQRSVPILLAGCLALVLGLFTTVAQEVQNYSKFERPIMVDSNGPGSELFVLDTWGTLHVLRVTPTSLQESASVSLPAELIPSDMAYASFGGEESVLVAGTQSGGGIVARYGVTGKLLQTWAFRNVCSGIDFVASNHSAYVATSDSNEIYQLDLQKADITFVSRIPGASKLGPLAFDESKQKIYVADIAAGDIYEYALATKSSKVLIANLSAPTALSFDPDAALLYIADPGRRAIFTVNPRSTKPVATQFVSSPLKSPYGMALMSNDRLAVADYGANSIFVFSDHRKLLFRFPPSN